MTSSLPPKDQERAINQQIGQRIKARRKEMGLSQEQLGSFFDLTYQQVQKYERGANRISAARLHMLCSALETPTDYYFTETPEELLLPPKTTALIEAWCTMRKEHRHMLEELAYIMAMHERVP